MQHKIDITIRKQITSIYTENYNTFLSVNGLTSRTRKGRRNTEGLNNAVNKLGVVVYADIVPNEFRRACFKHCRKASPKILHTLLTKHASASS